MASNSFVARVLVALSFVYAVIAVPAFDSFVYQPGNDANLTVAINIPSNSTTDLYIYFSASAQYQWAAFGFGDRMDDSLLLMLYTAANGANVTLSPRFSQNHNPVHSTDIQITPLAGSGVTTDGVMVLKALCTNCRKWSTGSIDVTSESQPMIYALGPEQPDFTSNSLDAKLSIHSVNSVFNLNLKKATGEGGVPDPTQATGPAISNSDDAETHEFPIAVHAFLLIACFLFILPGGYLFLRVFDRVWLHAGVQSLGIVFLLAGLAAGIIFNVQQKRAISYHQILGIITSFFVFSAFTLGAISHQYFKRRKVSSPLLKFHRIAGPSSIVLGWGTIISGFVFRGESRRILPFTVVLLAVIIFIGAIAFLMRKRNVRKAALETPAAQNFNAGYYGQQQAPGGGNAAAPPTYGAAHGYYGAESVPMQTFNQPHPSQQAGYGYPPPQQQQGVYVQKQPQVTVQSMNRI